MAGVPHWAVPGAKVVCVDAPWSSFPRIKSGMPVIGEVYTISRVGYAAPEYVGGADIVIISLRGITMTDDKKRERGFRLSHFRPLVDDATDREVEAEIFRKKRAHAPIEAVE